MLCMYCTPCIFLSVFILLFTSIYVYCRQKLTAILQQVTTTFGSKIFREFEVSAPWPSWHFGPSCCIVTVQRAPRPYHPLMMSTATWQNFKREVQCLQEVVAQRNWWNRKCQVRCQSSFRPPMHFFMRTSFSLRKDCQSMHWTINFFVLQIWIHTHTMEPI